MKSENIYEDLQRVEGETYNTAHFSSSRKDISLQEIKCSRMEGPRSQGVTGQTSRKTRTFLILLLISNALLLAAVVVLTVLYLQLLWQLGHRTEESKNVTTYHNETLACENKNQQRLDPLTSDCYFETYNQSIFMSKEKLQTICPNGWISFTEQTEKGLESSCYFISNKHYKNKEKNWIDSRLNCLDQKSDLVIINSELKRKFLNKHLDVAWYWIGLTDKENEGHWLWIDGTSLNHTGFWGLDQPDDAGFYWHEKYPDGEDCCSAELHYPNKIIMNDAPCTKQRPWICERKLELFCHVKI
ncbi:C-type lectin domain family 4 member E-like [Protopterus annectens]|uniref:C-type lectin domain family 4 member E-like n=1 Tax=Protopterus annectens TaxID=7888 RepID=UPI001CF94DA9|nr:C-type lectin domain family 4 member E-like [Protopterus annectens]